VCEELGISSTQTAFNAIARGKAYAIERGIDVEETRIKIQQLFDETIGLLAKTARTQHTEGAVTEFIDAEGAVSLKRIRGIDPRIAGELSRSLNRWAEFAGLLDRAPEQHVANTTTVVLAAPPAGADFDAHYDQMKLAATDRSVVSASSAAVGVSASEEGGPGWGAAPIDVTAA
jgi:hypothetical protein